MNNDQVKIAFLQWVKYFSPGLYTQVIDSAKLAGIFDVFSDIDWGGVVDKTVNLGTQYLQYDQQKDLLKAQAARANAGQMPLPTATATEIIYIQQAQPTAQQAQTQATIDKMVQYLPWMMGALILFKLMDLKRN